MRKLLKFTFLLPILFLAFSCSNGDDDSSNHTGTYFTIGDKEYDTSLYQPNGGIIQILSVFEDEKEAQLTLAGINGSEQGVVRFILNFPSTSTIDGNYVDGDVFEEIGVFDTESSIYSIVGVNQEMQSSEGAEGTLKIQNNGGNNYTIEFNVTYDDGTTAHGNITQDFMVQSI